MVETMFEEDEEAVIILMLKSPSSTIDFSLAGDRDAMKSCSSDKEWSEEGGQ